MKIMSPLLQFSDIDQFSEAGADEFYFGIYDERWVDIFGEFEEINRMSSFYDKANIPISQANRFIDHIHENGKKAFITFNSAVYTSEQREYILKIVYDFSSADGFIVADFELIHILTNLGFNVTVSTMGGCYNSLIIDHFAKVGVKRIIIPRDVTLNDIEEIVKKFPGIDFEVFIMRNGCRYSDSRCLSFHARRHGSLCHYLDISKSVLIFSDICNDEFKKETYADHKLYTYVFHKQACGLCAINQLRGIGVSSVKIVGRADVSVEVAQDISMIKAMITNNNLEKYDNCIYGLNCYYH